MDKKNFISMVWVDKNEFYFFCESILIIIEVTEDNLKYPEHTKTSHKCQSVAVLYHFIKTL